jgi:ABC-type amino acid transport substrate-binding protein
VSLGYALPTLGQVASLLFIPFAGWYVDRSLEPSATARMLLSAIPASVSGIKAVMRQELLQLGLPIDLLQLVYINGEWLYRFEKVLSLEGLVVLAVLVYARAVGAWRFRPGRALAGIGLLLGLSSVLGWSTRSALAYALQGTYRNDERLLSLTTTDTGPQPRDVQGPQPPQPVSLKAIKARGVLRVGLRSDGLPWAYRNNKGHLVGFDVDLLRRLATNLEVSLQIQEAPMPQLERWLAQNRVDLVAGGIQSSPSRAIQNELSRSYLQVHLALVVPDDKLKVLQPGSGARRTTPILLAVRDEELISPGIEQQISQYLSQGGPPSRVMIEHIPSKEAFFSRAGQTKFDGLLTSAESGASWAVIYPRTSLITPFSDDLNSELVLLIGGQDASLRRYINGFLTREQAQGGIETLFNHWILLKDRD